MRRLGELYHQHLTGTPVTIVLDDATDAGQVRTLIPERSDSLVIVTAREPLELPADIPAWVHHLPVRPLDAAGAEELLREVAGGEEAGPYDYPATDAVVELCGGLPLALRVAASSLGDRTRSALAEDLARVRSGVPRGPGPLAALHRPERGGPAGCCGGSRWLAGPVSVRRPPRPCWRPTSRRPGGGWRS
ncbi:hypothetical protein SMICM17S_11947 [Streptomyces microflavus]